MTQSYISHEGVVDSISENCVHVRIVQSSACSSCKVASYCTSAESKEKVVDVFTSKTDIYEIGERVNVMAKVGVGYLAVLFGFCLPTVLLIASIVIALYAFDCDEAKAALIGLASLIPYYTLLYICNGRFKKMMRFSISK